MSEDILAEARAALTGLKDFQLETVEHVHSRLYAPDGSGRFLVADEVGLGKTLIARGVVARAIQTLHDDPSIDRIDVVYICSNADIARQNLNRLKFKSGQVALDTRLTLMPKHVAELGRSKAKLNFVAFTPATSFDLKDGLGRVEERALLCLMLRHVWKLGNAAPPVNVMRGGAGIDTFRSHLDSLSLEEIDPEQTSTKAFFRAIERHDAAEPDPQRRLHARFERLCEAFPRFDSRPGREVTEERTRFVGQLRSLLAASCLSSLKPDIVILDEFQRFAHLLEPDNGDAQLAQELFAVEGVRVLLLSATPYRMYTPAGEETGEDHYDDFVRTVGFLEKTRSESTLKPLLREYRDSMLELGLTQSPARLENAARELERRLRRVMVRTERLGATQDRNGMLHEVKTAPSPMTKADALGYVALSRIARAVEHHEPLDYWKSAPYVLNFMESDYALTQRLQDARSDPAKRLEIAQALAAQGHHRFDTALLQNHQPLDPGNGRLRQLVEQTVGRGAHRMLWLPPSMPYYRTGGAHAEPALRDFTKRLVFTSWRFVPRAIAGYLSYEAERLMYGDGKRREGRLLKFSRADGRVTGMPVLALMYPSSYLAQACDPLRLSREVGGTPSAADVIDAARNQIEISLERLPKGHNDGAVDQRWYWAAPLLLDAALYPDSTRAWFEIRNLAALWAGGEEEEIEGGTGDREAAWEAHVEAAREMIKSKGADLGRRPEDLSQVLAELAIGGPGACLLRSMLRVVGLKTTALQDEVGRKVRTAAAAAAWAFRALYNQPEVTQLLQRETESVHAELSEDRYWRVVLRYGVSGCLQAVLDEYAHVLRDHLGGGEANVHEIAEHMRQALSLRAANITVRDVRASAGGRTLEEGATARVNCHFAVRFGDQKADDGSVATRADLVRRAFNSPFWPFVLATTSVGQEGLDFHPYCHAVVHWNLPTNPVDLEQREGRVHRYKGHAVRKNVARHFADEVATGEGVDAWQELFRLASERKPPKSTDIIPFWVFATEGGARIERHVLALPSSREYEQVQRLLKALTLYRMVFGQPRQEDMLRFLRERVPSEALEKLLEATRITLVPSAHESEGSRAAR